MTTLPAHLAAAMPSFVDSVDLTLLILAATITLVFAAIRWTVRRTRALVMIIGTSVLLVLLTILLLAYLSTVRTL